MKICKDHRGYGAIQKPRSKCKRCWEIYNDKQQRKPLVNAITRNLIEHEGYLVRHNDDHHALWEHSVRCQIDEAIAEFELRTNTKAIGDSNGS